jgi:L-ascorbate metabolism protein UlaG (beta-lactamase superfamily)
LILFIPLQRSAQELLEITRLSGASWFKIKSENQIIHFDPGYTGYFQNQRIPLQELEDKADLILISHFHKDHLQPEALEKIVNEDSKILAPQSCTDRIKYRFTCIKPGDFQNFGEIKIKAVDAYNTDEGHSTRKVHHKGAFVGYQVYLDGKWIYFAGDTDFIPEMSGLGKTDIALLPIGGTFVMDIEEAVKATLLINPKLIIPMHQSKNDPNVFKNNLLSKFSVEVRVLGIGEKARY